MTTSELNWSGHQQRRSSTRSRCFLVAITVAGVSLSAVLFVRGVRRRDAIDVLQSRGARIIYRDRVVLSSMPLWFRSRRGARDFIDSPEYIDASRAPLGDSDLELVRQIPGLSRLDLDHTAVTDAGLIHLHDMKDLREVDLTGLNVSDEAIAGLQQSLPACRIRH